MNRPPDSPGSAVGHDGLVRRARRLLDMDETPVPADSWEPPTETELQSLLPDYEFIELVGRGGMGAVYKARQVSLDRLVAVKVLPLGDDPEYAERFKNEARLLARMNHPGIVHVYDFGEAGAGMLYFVMEYVDGTDVARMVAGNGRLSVEHAVSITADVCAALHYAHSHGVVHRDVKPANVLVSKQGLVKVADFGIAQNQEHEGAGLTTGLVPGTPEFAAPETLMTGVVVDHRADIYAVGVMLYNMLTGEIPRGVFPPLSEKIQTPPAFDEVIRKAMAADREKRYQTAQALKTDVQKANTAAVMTPRRWWQHKVWRAAAAIALFACTAVVVLRPQDNGTEKAKNSDGPAVSAAKAPARAVADWVFSLGGGVMPASYTGGLVKNAAGLPPGDLVLEAIVFDGVKSGAITDADLRRVLPELRSLSRLEVRDSPGLLKGVTREGLKALATFYQLEALTLEDVPVKDDDLSFLAGLPLLRELNLSGSQIAGTGLRRLHGKLDRLDLRGCPLTEAGCREIAAIPGLATLDLNHSAADNACVRALQTAGGLRQLSVHQTGVTSAELSQFLKAVPGCRIVPDYVRIEKQRTAAPPDSVPLNVLRWGAGAYGQTGDGWEVQHSPPGLIAPAGGEPLDGKVVALDGFYHVLALLDSGKLAAWGMNNWGQCGGQTPSYWRPRMINVPGLPFDLKIRLIAAGGDSSYAVMEDGRLFAWGGNRHGELGDGTTRSRASASPVLFPDETHIVALEPGWQLKIGLDDKGRLFQWGRSADSGIIKPVEISEGLPPGDPVISMAGTMHHLLLTASGKVFAWGENQFGQLGNGSTASSATPVPVDADGVLRGIKVREIHAGAEHSVAVAEDGRVFTWGRNANGSLGDGTERDSLVPVAVAFTGPLEGCRVQFVAVANAHNFAITTNNELIFWGHASHVGSQAPAITGPLLAPGVELPARQPVKLEGILPEGRKVKALRTASHSGMLLLE